MTKKTEPNDQRGDLYIVKNMLPEGKILHVTGIAYKFLGENRIYFRTNQNVNSNRILTVGKEVFFDRKEAEAEFEALRIRKVQSLKKQAKKYEDMVLGLKEHIPN